MSLNTLRWAAGAVLALSVGLVAVSALYGDEDDKKASKEAAEDVLKLVGGGGGGIDAAAIAKKHKLEHVMHGFKPRARGGIGVGDVPNKAEPNKDGIEVKLRDLAKQEPMTKGDLQKETAGLTKAAKVTRAIADIAEYYTPKEKMADRDPRDWKKYNDDMKKGEDDLIDALKKGDPAQVKKAAGRLNRSCNECHGKFRDEPN